MNDNTHTSKEFIAVFKRGMMLLGGGIAGVIDYKKEECGELSNVYGRNLTGVIYPNNTIPPDYADKTRREFRINKEDTIVLLFGYTWFKRYVAMGAITDRALYLSAGSKVIQWSEVERVEYFKKNFVFYSHNNTILETIFEGNTVDNWYWLRNSTRAKTKDDYIAIASFFTDLAKAASGRESSGSHVTIDTQTVNKDEETKIYEELRSLKENNKNDEVISLLQKHSSVERFSVFDLMLSKEYLRQERYQEALNTLKRSASNLFPTQDYNSAALLSFDKGRAEYALGLLADARRDFLYASSIAKDVRYEDSELGIFGFIRDLSIDYFNRVDEEYRKGFLSLPYFERKLLLVVKEYSDLTATHFSIFQFDRRPEISFPVGHPIPNQLYVGHPYTPNVYMPFDTYELTLVEDRIREFCLLSQYLGATEITIEALNTSQSESSKATNSGISGGGSYKIVSAGASINNQSSQKLLEAISKSISIHQEFTPYLPPSLPDGLLWYPSEPSWQRLYEQRMRGQDVHEERIETRKSQVVGGSELQEIKAEIKTLVLSVHGEWSNSLEESLTQQENAVLSIKVKFAPLSQLTGNQSRVSSMLSTSERDYLDEVKAVLEDGAIGPRERKSLERASIRLGISEVRAAEIEASVSAPKLTDEENAYLAEVKAILEDGEIGPRERKSLERTRNRLGISEERAKEIESL